MNNSLYFYTNKNRFLFYSLIKVTPKSVQCVPAVEFLGGERTCNLLRMERFTLQQKVGTNPRVIWTCL